jgi:hypothetical protein
MRLRLLDPAFTPGNANKSRSFSQAHSRAVPTVALAILFSAAPIIRIHPRLSLFFASFAFFAVLLLSRSIHQLFSKIWPGFSPKMQSIYGALFAFTNTQKL